MSSLLHHITYVPSPFLSSTESTFLMHHLPWKRRTFSMLFLHHYIDSHHAHLLSDASGQVGRTILKFINNAIAGLKAALTDDGEMLKVETALTTISLCMNDVCDRNLDLWRMHLTGVKELLCTFLKQQKGNDPFVVCLLKWFATLDVSDGLSGLHKSCVRDGLYWSVNKQPSLCTGYVDDICGYSLELMPLLADIGKLARLRHEQLRSEIKTQEGGILEHSEMEIMEKAHGIESRVLSLQCTVSEATWQSHGKDLAKELQSTHSTFIHATLLHLHHRVRLLPKDHPKVRDDVDSILSAVDNIRPFSTANILILLPIFSGGCETDIMVERDVIQQRMANMRSLGMDNFQGQEKS